MHKELEIEIEMIIKKKLFVYWVSQKNFSTFD